MEGVRKKVAVRNFWA